MSHPRVSYLSDDRQIADAINYALKRIEGFPFQKLSSAPTSPVEGQIYYDLTLHKARTFDGTAWNNLW